MRGGVRSKLMLSDVSYKKYTASLKEFIGANNAVYAETVTQKRGCPVLASSQTPM